MGTKRPLRIPRLPMPPLLDHGWVPEVELSADDHTMVARVDLPGLRPEQVTLAVTDGHLAITGERPAHVDGVPATCYVCERAFGPFYRAIPLPPGVDPGDVTAVLADGVLEVTVPYPAHHGARAIAILDAPRHSTG